MTRPVQAPSSLRRNAVANVAGRGASALLWVALTPYALDRLGPERFGVWSLFFALGGYVATLDLGMTSGTARFVAVSAARGDRLGATSVLRRSLSLGAAVGLFWCIACLALRGEFVSAFHVPEILAPEVGRSLGWFALSMLAFSITQVLCGALQGFQRLDLSNIAMVAGLAVQGAVLVGGLWMGKGLIATAVAAVCGYAFAGAIAARWVMRAMRALPDAGEGAAPVSWRELLGFGGTLQATAAFAVGQLQVGKVLLGILGQLVWVTQFELGFRVANAVWALPTLIQGAVIPAAAQASVTGAAQDLRVVYQWACRWVFALAGVALAGLWLVAPALMTLWIGPDHPEAIPIARMLAVVFAIATLAGPATAVARGGGWPALETTMIAIAFVLNLGLALWAVPHFGPAGAVLALGVSYALAGAWFLVVFHRRIAIPTAPWLARMAAPRFLLPAVAAAAVAVATSGWVISGRATALPLLAVQSIAYGLLAVLLLWPTGDPATVMSRAREWTRRAAAGRVSSASVR